MIVDSQGNKLLTKEEVEKTEKLKGILATTLSTLIGEGLTDVQDCVVLGVNLIMHGLNFIPPEHHELYAKQTLAFVANSLAQGSAAIKENAKIARNVMKTPTAH